MTDSNATLTKRHDAYLGLDVGKESHWGFLVDRDGEVLMSRRVTNTEAALDAALAALPTDAGAEAVQDAALDVARAIPRYQNLNAKGATPERPGVSGDWWKAIYQVMFGEDQGPRFGSFAAIYGLDNTRKLIAKALDGGLIREHESFLAARQPLSA